MERKTNKAKLEIFKFLRKSILSQGKFYKNMLIRVFLHAEFISAKKTVENPKSFMKNRKKQKNE